MKTADPFFAGFLLASLLFISPAQAQPPGSGDEPSAEFLEFLGEFETEEGEWVDPDELPPTEKTEKPTEEKQNEKSENKS